MTFLTFYTKEKLLFRALYGFYGYSGETKRRVYSHFHRTEGDSG